MYIKQLVIMSAVVGLNFVSHGGVIAEFADVEPSKAIHSAEGRDQFYEIVEDAEIGDSVAKVSWDENVFHFADIYSQSKKKLDIFENATYKAKFYMPADKPITSMGLRFIDAKGEVFQWNKKIRSNKVGWQNVFFKITPNNFSHAWGSNPNRVVEQPCRLLGLGVTFKRGSGRGHILLDNVSFVSSNFKKDKIMTKSSLASFGEDEKWYVRNSGGTAKKVANKDTFHLSGDSNYYLMFKRKWRILHYDLPEKLELFCKLNSGNTKAHVVFKGRKNKKATTTTLSLSADKESYVLEIGDALKKLHPPLKVQGIVLQNASKDLDITFDKIDLYTKEFPLDAVKLDVVTGTPIHVLKDGEEDKLGVEFTNTALTPITFTADVSFENFYGDSIRLTKDFTLGPQSKKVWKSPARPSEHGIWWVNYNFIDPNGKMPQSTGQRSFSYMKPAGPTPGKSEGFIFGMCTHTARWSKVDREKEIMAVAMCGSKVVRTGPEWPTLQPTKDGPWNFTPLDELVDSYEKQGIEIQALFGFTPKWAAPLEKQKSKSWKDWGRCAPDLGAFENYTRTLAQRYDGRIRYWEVWNEPDIGFFRGTYDEYSDMLKVAYKAVKEGSPSAQVLTGGFATLGDHPSRTDKQFHEKVLKNDQANFDVHAYHEHGSFGKYTKMVDGQLLKLREKHGVTVPWYANETAVSSLDGAEKMQAEVLYKKILFTIARGGIGYNWYDLRNDGFDPVDGEHNYGIITNDFYPKAGYPVYNALVNSFRGVPFDRQVDLAKNIWCFVFKNDNEILIPAWDEALGRADNQCYIFKTDAVKAEIVDIMGNVSSTPVLNGMAIAGIGKTPSCLRLVGGSKAESIGQLIEIPELKPAVQGQPYSVKVKIFNPFDEDKKFRLSFNTPAGISRASVVEDVEVAKRSEVVKTFVFDISNDLGTGKIQSLDIKMVYDLQNSPWNGEVSIPVNFAALIPKGGFDRKPDFVLKDRTKVVSLCEADPSKVHLIWKDKDDLSLKLWLGTDGENLQLKAEVTDDVHMQDYKDGSVWKGDNIQIGLSIPGQVGLWEVGLSQLADGSPEVFAWSVPKGIDKNSFVDSAKLETSRLDKVTTYSLSIPLKSLDVDYDKIKNGVRMNLLVNDNDEGIREGWMHLAPGLGTGKVANKFPFIVFE